MKSALENDLSANVLDAGIPKSISSLNRAYAEITVLNNSGLTERKAAEQVGEKLELTQMVMLTKYRKYKANGHRRTHDLIKFTSKKEALVGVLQV